MSQIHVKTLLEALDPGPAHVFFLSEKTGYNTGLVFKYIMEARQEGHLIGTRWYPESLSTFEHKKECACGDDKND